MDLQCIIISVFGLVIINQYTDICWQFHGDCILQTGRSQGHSQEFPLFGGYDLMAQWCGS